MHRRLRAPAVALTLLLFTALGVALAPLSTGAPVADPSESVAGYVLPRMVALDETVAIVRDMIRERSRNIVALRAHADRIDRIVADIDAWIAVNGDDDAVAEAVLEYQRGRDAVGDAIADARTALATLDFSGMEALVHRFDTGAGHLERALELFRMGA